MSIEVILICYESHFAGKVTVYLGKRDFIDHLDTVDPIDGVVVVENDYLKGRRVYGQVSEMYLGKVQDASKPSWTSFHKG